MQSIRACLSTVVLLAIGVGTGLAAGTAVVVDPDAIVRSDGEQRTLFAGDTIEIGDVIQTANNGHVELTFDDGTKIVVGPGSAHGSVILDPIIEFKLHNQGLVLAHHVGENMALECITVSTKDGGDNTLCKNRFEHDTMLWPPDALGKW